MPPCNYLESCAVLFIEPTFLSHVSNASFDSIDPDMASILDRASGDHPKLFVA